jgi:solute carrier family 31 (copper transporter), member 1
MLWNWYTIDSCFISSTWHVTSDAMFAGSCIGVVLLVMVLEFLRRATKELDRYLIRKHAAASSSPSAAAPSARLAAAAASSSSGASPKASVSEAATLQQCHNVVVNKGFRPSILEQAIRALLHMTQFAVAYFIML